MRRNGMGASPAGVSAENRAPSVADNHANISANSNATLNSFKQHSASSAPTPLKPAQAQGKRAALGDITNSNKPVCLKRRGVRIPRAAPRDALGRIEDPEFIPPPQEAVRPPSPRIVLGDPQRSAVELFPRSLLLELPPSMDIPQRDDVYEQTLTPPALSPGPLFSVDELIVSGDDLEDLVMLT